MNTAHVSHEVIIKFLLPIFGAFVHSLIVYGVSETKNQLLKWVPLKVAAIIFLSGMAIMLLFRGESWFCGKCFSKWKTGAFFFPSLGCAMILFPDSLTGNIFNTSQERMNSVLITVLGIALAAVGIILIEARGDL